MSGLIAASACGAGITSTDAEAVTLLPPFRAVQVATTVYFPAVAEAVYTPAPVIVPPVAGVTSQAKELPVGSLGENTAVNVAVDPVATVAEAGLMDSSGGTLAALGAVLQPAIAKMKHPMASAVVPSWMASSDIFVPPMDLVFNCGSSSHAHTTDPGLGSYLGFSQLFGEGGKYFRNLKLSRGNLLRFETDEPHRLAQLTHFIRPLCSLRCFARTRSERSSLSSTNSCRSFLNRESPGCGCLLSIWT
jgi:hypothetical protein